MSARKSTQEFKKVQVQVLKRFRFISAVFCKTSEAISQFFDFFMLLEELEECTKGKKEGCKHEK